MFFQHRWRQWQSRAPEGRGQYQTVLRNDRDSLRTSETSARRHRYGGTTGDPTKPLYYTLYQRTICLFVDICGIWRHLVEIVSNLGLLAWIRFSGQWTPKPRFNLFHLQNLVGSLLRVPFFTTSRPSSTSVLEDPVFVKTHYVAVRLLLDGLSVFPCHGPSLVTIFPTPQFSFLPIHAPHSATNTTTSILHSLFTPDTHILDGCPTALRTTIPLLPDLLKLHFSDQARWRCSLR